MGSGMWGQLLGSVLSGRGAGGGGPEGLGGLLGGGLGGALGGSVQRPGRGDSAENVSAGLPAQGFGSVQGRSGLGGGGRATFMMMLLPLALQWVQRSGGVGSVVQRFGQRGYGTQAASWVGTGENQDLDADSVQDVVGPEEISRMSAQCGVPEDEVRGGLAELLPELVNQSTPQGQIGPEADDRIGRGASG